MDNQRSGTSWWSDTKVKVKEFFLWLFEIEAKKKSIPLNPLFIEAIKFITSLPPAAELNFLEQAYGKYVGDIHDLQWLDGAKPSSETPAQECDATAADSKSLLETKILLPSWLTNKSTTMFQNIIQKIKDDTNWILARIGLISSRLISYITLAISFGYNIISALASPLAKIVIADLLPAGTDPALLEDFAAGVVKAIAYLTDAEDILKAPTPDAMLQLFLQDLAKDVPGLQKTKIYAFVWNIVAHLDGNNKLDSSYAYLVQKEVLKGKLLAKEPANNVAAPIPQTNTVSIATS